MSEESKTTETPASGANRPTHVAYQIRDGKDEGIWTRIGAAWRHKDGKGFNLQLDAVPLDGRITLREASETKA